MLSGFVWVLPDFVATVAILLKQMIMIRRKKGRGAIVSSRPPPTGNRREIETDAWGWHSALMGRLLSCSTGLASQPGETNKIKGLFSHWSVEQPLGPWVPPWSLGELTF